MSPFWDFRVFRGHFVAGRPRKPTAYLELVGADKKNPKRFEDRANEPRDLGPLGDPPPWLNEAEQARWRNIADWCGKWLTIADRVLVEQTARLWQLCADRKAKPADEKLLASNLIRLGMTPADRSRVNVTGAKKPKSNPFGALTG